MLLTCSATAQEPFVVRVEGPGEGPHYVGQAIGATLRVTAGSEEPTVELPSVEGVDLFLSGKDVRPIMGGAIGKVVHESNLYVFQLILVPRRAGRVVVSAIKARTAEAGGVAAPIRVEAITPPGFGRPNWFLGGVGPMEVELIARPESIRLGESVEVSVELRGLGALGSTIRPSLRGTEGSAIEAEVVPLSPTLATEGGPPSRAFPFRFRPTKPGMINLAPVLVAWFDPGTRQYQTIGSRGVSIRVDDPPRFDPSLIEVAEFEEDVAGSEGKAGTIGRLGLGLGGGAVFGGLALVVWWGVWRWERSPRWYARRAARRLSGRVGPERAERAATALAGYLSRATGRPEGAITPPEAHEAIEAVTGDAALARRASRLIAGSDAIRYSGREEAGEDREPMDDAVGFFRALSRATVGRRTRDRSGVDRDREGGRRE